MHLLYLRRRQRQKVPEMDSHCTTVKIYLPTCDGTPD